MKNTRVRESLRAMTTTGAGKIMRALGSMRTTTIRRIIVIFILVNLVFMASYGYLHSQSEAADERKPATTAPAKPPIQAVVSPEMQWSALQKRQEEQRVKEMELKALEGELNVKLRRLEELESLIRQDVTSLRTQSDERIKHLVKIYSSMQPKAASKLMDNMDLLVAVEVFHNMKGEIAGGILANMDATKAAAITKMLATYRAAAKQQAVAAQ